MQIPENPAGSIVYTRASEAFEEQRISQWTCANLYTRVKLEICQVSYLILQANVSDFSLHAQVIASLNLFSCYKQQVVSQQ